MKTRWRVRESGTKWINSGSCVETTFTGVLGCSYRLLIVRLNLKFQSCEFQKHMIQLNALLFVPVFIEEQAAALPQQIFDCESEQMANSPCVGFCALALKATERSRLFVTFKKPWSQINFYGALPIGGIGKKGEFQTRNEATSTFRHSHPIEFLFGKVNDWKRLLVEIFTSSGKWNI